MSQQNNEQQNNEKKEEPGIDTSYGANAGTGTTPEISTPTTTVDTSYGANGTGTTPTGTPAPTGTTTLTGGTSGVDTSYGANTGNVFSFSEWAKSEEERLAREKDLTYQRAEELRQQEYDNAAVARERAVADARTSYAQNMAGYGAKAEQLGSMGLAGSGYGDYMDSQAYATQRAEVQYANAQERAAQRQARYAEQEAKDNADVSYSQNMSALGKETVSYLESKMNEEQQELFSSLVAQVQSGTLTKEQAIEQARAGGLSDAVIGMITAAADTYTKTEDEKGQNEAYNATLANVNAGNYDSADAVRAAAEAAGITDANLVNQLVAAWTTHNKSSSDEFLSNYTNLMDLARNGTWTAEDIGALASRYGISGEDLTALQNAARTAYTAAEAERGQISEETYNQNYGTVESLAKSGQYTAEEIRAWCERLKIDNEEDVERLVAIVQKVTASNNQYEYIVSTGAITSEFVEEIEAGVESGDVSSADRDKWAQQWNSDMMETEDCFLDNSGGRLSKKDAQAMLDETINNPWCTPELETYLRAQYSSIYKTEVCDVSAGFTTNVAEGSYAIYLYYGGKQFSVIDPPKAEGDVLVAAQDLPDGTVFVHGVLTDHSGGVYYKQGGVVYSLDGDTSDGGVKNSDGSIKMSYFRGYLTGEYTLPDTNENSNTQTTTIELDRAPESFMNNKEHKLPPGNWTPAQQDILWNAAYSNNFAVFSQVLPMMWSDEYKRQVYEEAGGRFVEETRPSAPQYASGYYGGR